MLRDIYLRFPSAFATDNPQKSSEKHYKGQRKKISPLEKRKFIAFWMHARLRFSGPLTTANIVIIIHVSYFIRFAKHERKKEKSGFTIAHTLDFVTVVVAAENEQSPGTCFECHVYKGCVIGSQNNFRLTAFVCR